MFAMRVRVSPCSARSSPRSVGRVTVIVPLSCSIFIRCGTTWESSPSGPLTITRPGESATFTPAGTSMGCLPIRLMSLPDEANDLSADAALLSGSAGDHAGRRGEDRRPHPTEHPREPVLARVDAAARLGDPLEVGDDALAVPAEPQFDDESIEALAVADVVIVDVALLLEQARDVHLNARGGHLDRVLQRLVRVADSGEHVGDRIGQHLVPPTTSSWSCQGSRPRGQAPVGRSGRARTS